MASATQSKQAANGTAPVTPVEHKTLAEALVAFQAEAPTLGKDATNPHFRSKYTPLDTIVETIRPLLARHGLAWSALPCIVDGAPALRYRLLHGGSGETLEDTMPLLAQKQDPQGMGSALTYARRYSLTAVLNLVSDDDDDGNAASRPQQQERQTQRPQPTAEPSNGGPRLASAKQRGLLNVKAGEAGLSASGFANAILLAGGAEEPREFDSEEAAKALVNRMLDRLPAALVDPTLQAIEAAVA